MAAKGGCSAIRSPTSRALSRSQQGGRLRSESVADFRRNRWPDCVGISGQLQSESASKGTQQLVTEPQNPRNGDGNIETPQSSSYVFGQAFPRRRKPAHLQ